MLLSIVSVLLAQSWSGASADRASRSALTPIANALPKVENFAGKLPLAFELNVGQADPRIKFMSQQNDAQVLLLGDGASLKPRGSRSAMRMKLNGANEHASIRGADALPGHQNYLLGNKPAKWHTDVPLFSRVVYEEIYPHTNLIFYGNEGELEYDFELAPGADSDLIRLSFGNHVRLRLDEDGSLIIGSRDGELKQRRPVVYQDLAGQRQAIAGDYVLLSKHEVGFRVGEYDRSRTLVIDPTLVFSTYLGGAGDDSGSSIARDSSGNIYLAGSTTSVRWCSASHA